MADQGLWWKLWCSALDDDALADLSIEDFGRWAKLGAHVKRHGTQGVLKFSPPARLLCHALQVDDFQGLVNAIKRLPNVEVSTHVDDVTSETNAIVTFRNWQRYQGDNSTARVQAFRSRETIAKRGMKQKADLRSGSSSFSSSTTTTTTPPLPPLIEVEKTPRPVAAKKAKREDPDGFVEFWSAYPENRRRGRQEAVKAWLTLRLTPEDRERLMVSLESWKASEDWQKDDGQFIPWPCRFLSKRRWEEIVGPVRRRGLSTAVLLGEEA